MEKLSEIEIRRKLVRQGYMLHKERKSKTNPDSTGGYMVFDIKNNAVVAGGRYDLTLQGVADFLNKEIRTKTQTAN
jgi:hypothetical protein